VMIRFETGFKMVLLVWSLFLLPIIHAAIVKRSTYGNGENLHNIREVGTKGYLTSDCADAVNGRQVLILSLLETFNRNYFAPRYMNKVQLYLPESLRSHDQPTQVPERAILLPELSLGNGVLLRDELLQKARPCFVIGRKDHATPLDKRFDKSVEAIIALSFQFKDFLSCLSFLVVIRDYCNQAVYTAAIYDLILKREDLANFMPDMSTYMAKDFFPTAALRHKDKEDKETGCYCLDAREVGEEGHCKETYQGKPFCYSSRGCADAVPSSVIVGVWSVQACQKKNPKFTEILWNHPPYKTMPDYWPESKLGYFREDPTLNAHYGAFYLRLTTSTNPINVYPFFTFDLKDKDLSLYIDRRGEVVYSMLRNLVARYNLERFSNDLKTTCNYCDAEWRLPVVDHGYNSKLNDKRVFGVSDDYYKPREDFSVWSESWRNDLISGWIRTLYSDMENGELKDYWNSTNTPLVAKNGRDLGIGPLVDAMQAYAPSSVNNPLYGDIMTATQLSMGRMVPMVQKGEADHHNKNDPHYENDHHDHENLNRINVLGSPNTCLRDPLIYRLYKFWLTLLDVYKGGLPQYTNHELDFPGVKIDALAVQSKNKINQLFTFQEKSEIGVLGLDFNSLTEGMDSVFPLPTNKDPHASIVQFERLNHIDWDYQVKISSEKNTVGMFRLFLLPADDFKPIHGDQPLSHHAVELDKWPIHIVKGSKVYSRDPKSSPYFREPLVCKDWPCDYQEKLMKGEYSYDQLNKDNCGFPRHLMLPRGNKAGMKFRLFGMVSKLLEKDQTYKADWLKLDGYAWASCGANPGVPYPDSRPMGFPLDRSPLCRKEDTHANSYGYQPNHYYGQEQKHVHQERGCVHGSLEALTEGRTNMVTTNVLVKFIENKDIKLG